MSGTGISNPSSRSLGLAIVGCGQIVTHHLDAMASCLQGKIIIRALCDPSEERRKVIANLPSSSVLCNKQESCDNTPKQFSSLDDLISSETDFAKVDIIFIAVPHDLHETLAMQALEQSRNKFVVMEKPLAPTLDSCKRLVEVSQKLASSKSDDSNNHDSMLIIAEQSPYWEEVARAKHMISSGSIGRIVTAAGYYYESMRTNITSGSVDETSGALGWRGSVARAGGGIAIDGGLHWIRPLREMLHGRIEEVVGIVRRDLAPELRMEGEVLGHALFKIAPPPNSSTSSDKADDCDDSSNPLTQPVGAGPLIATYSCNMLATAPMAHDACPFFRITGTKGELIIHGTGLDKHTKGSGGLRLYDEEHPAGVELFSTDRLGGFFLGFAGLWREIHRICINMDKEAAHETVVRASDDVRTALALYRSAASGRWEKT